MDDARFAISAHYNDFLSPDATRVDAIITVTAERGERAPVIPAAQVLLIDRSGSMAGRRIEAAREAAAAAVRTMPDGTLFAVVSGGDDARNVYPGKGLAVAERATREAALKAIRLISADSLTHMSTWLAEARDLLRGARATVKHAILLTDGENGEPRGVLEKTLRACKGEFVCDARGVGEDWRATELRLIADTLGGSADGLVDPGGLAAEFASITAATVGRIAGDVALRLWTPPDATIVSLREVWPRSRDLGEPRRVDRFTRDHATGAWGAESRDFHLVASLPSGPVGDERLLARVAVVAGGVVRAQALITAERTTDVTLAAAIDPKVAHYRDQRVLATAIRAGLAAHRSGDAVTAAAELGRAVRLAAGSGNEEALATLSSLVEIDDAATGRVRLSAKARSADVEVAELRADRAARPL